MLFSGNSIWYPVIMFAALRIGGIVSGASPAYGVEEMVYALKTAEARFLVMDGRDEEKLQVGLEAAKRVGIEEEQVFVMEKKELGRGFISVKELAELGKDEKQTEELRIPAEQTNRDVCAFLCFRWVT